MFLKVFGLYLQGLGLSVIFVLVLSLIWTLWRVCTRVDKTKKERQSFLYDLVMMILITIPVLSFAFMAILLMVKA